MWGEEATGLFLMIVFVIGVIRGIVFGWTEEDRGGRRRRKRGW